MMEPREIDPKILVRDSYDRISHAYRGDMLPRNRGYFKWLGVLGQYLKEGDSVLDLECGCGIPVAAELAPSHGVTGVDISPVQIARARSLVPNARFQCEDMAAVLAMPMKKHTSRGLRSSSSACFGSSSSPRLKEVTRFCWRSDGLEECQPA